MNVKVVAAIVITTGLLIFIDTGHACDLHPEADLTADMDFGVIFESITVTFDGTGSYDPDKSGGLEGIHKFSWDFGDGGTYYETPSHYPDGAFDGKHARSYNRVGSYDVTLTVYDSQGGHDSATFDLRIVCTILDAVGNAAAGNVIVIGEGIYAGPGNRDIMHDGSAIEIRSTDPDDPAVIAATIIECGGSSTESHRAFDFSQGEGPDVVVRGITIRNGYRDFGGAILCEGASPTITNCVFSNNTADYGGAICCELGSSPTIRSCVFAQNKASVEGGGIRPSGSDPTVTNCVFTGNEADQGGGGMHNSNSSPTIRNCTFFGNKAGDSGLSIFNEDNSGPTVTNCILWGNILETDDEITSDESSTAFVSYCDVGEEHTGDGNISVDPRFVDPDNPAGADGVFRTSDDGLQLMSDSPYSGCIDTGSDTAVSDLTTDIIGNPRISDGDHQVTSPDTDARTVDMGAYEAVPVWYVDDDISSGDGKSWASAFQDLQGALALAADGDEIWVAEGTYKPGVGRTASFELKSGVDIYGGFAGTESIRAQRDWTLHNTTLSGDIGTPGSQGDNSYHVVWDVGVNDTVLDGVRIVSGCANGGVSPHYRGGGIYCSGASPTIRNCSIENNASSHGGGMYCTSSSPTLTNCTFVNNSAATAAGMYSDFSSPVLTGCIFNTNTAWVGGRGTGTCGGMYNYHSSAVLTGCTFSGNITNGQGAGMYNSYSSPKVTGCVFSENHAGESSYYGYGGAMYNAASSPIVTNCIFASNSAANGGGLYSHHNTSYPTLVNCTFVTNTASGSGGGIYCLSASPVVANCILWGNSDGGGTDESAQIHNDYGTVLINYSCVKDWTGILGGVGNIGQDPRFVDLSNPIGPDEIFGTLDDGLRLWGEVVGQDWVHSPCVDTGDAEASPLTDIVGRGRINVPYIDNGSAGYADMGAYESMTVWFVKKDADGLDNGTSWKDAFTELRDALANANLAGGHEIWVAKNDQEAYKPTTSQGPRSASFELVEGVGIYGGFAGAEEWRTARDWQTNETVLSGDLSGNDLPLPDSTTRAENSYNVVKALGVNSAVLDGFTIMGGYANGSSPEDVGAGIYCSYTTHTISNCLIKANWATSSGGGMYNGRYSRPMVINCEFSGNKATDGGGMYNIGLPSELMYCIFADNVADGDGAGMYNSGSSPDLIYCEFTDNVASSDGGGMCNSHDANSVPSCPNMIHCDFERNQATGGYGGALYNLDDCSPTITDGRFNGNVAYRGGAIANRGASPELVECEIRLNEASDLGGGIYNLSGNAQIISCDFSENEAPYGGGMYNKDVGYSEVANCTFTGNEALGSLLRGGGALYNKDSFLTVRNCRFYGNSAVRGGAIRNDDSSPHLTNCLFVGNTAWYGLVLGFGGAIYNLTNQGGSGSNPMIVNCTFTQNAAYGTYGKGGALYNYSASPWLVNCVFWNDTAVYSGPEIYNYGSTSPSIHYCDIQGCYPGGSWNFLLGQDFLGNTDDEPDFVEQPYDGGDGWDVGDDFGDLRLYYGSPCIDRGDNNWVIFLGSLTDIDGYRRRIDDAHTPDDFGNGTAPIVDMGAHEYWKLGIDAGEDQEITLPTRQAQLEGRLTNGPEELARRTLWSCIKRPPGGSVTFDSPFKLDAMATFAAGVDGRYILKLIADSKSGEELAEDCVFITVKPGPDDHSAPIVQASLDPDDFTAKERTIVLPKHVVNLYGRAGDDGMPNKKLKITWSLAVADPSWAEVRFGNSSVLDTTAEFSMHGKYVLQLTADDGDKTAHDTVKVVVEPDNLPPKINAGTNQEIQLPDNDVTLAGKIVEDETPSAIEPSWSVVAAKGGAVVFNPSPPTDLDATATFTAPGTYVLRLDAVDEGGLEAEPDTVLITVHPALTVDAGENQETTDHVLTLHGEIKNDYLDRVTNRVWSVVSKPDGSTVNWDFSPPHSDLEPEVTLSHDGDYVFRLEAKEGTDVIGLDEVHIRVLDEAPPVGDYIYTSYVLTMDDLIFFSYDESGVKIKCQPCDENGNPISAEETVLNGGQPLIKGQHDIVDGPKTLYSTATGVYKVFSSSSNFTVLTGDPTVEAVSGYYAMNPEGLGVGAEFYTYVPSTENPPDTYPQCYRSFVIIAHDDGTTVTLQKDDTGGGEYVNVVDPFQLNEGEHWNSHTDYSGDFSDIYVHVKATGGRVSVLTSHDSGYYVPSDDGAWGGTEFYAFVDVHAGCYADPWIKDLRVTAHDDYTAVEIRNIGAAPGELLWSGLLHAGRAHVQWGRSIDWLDIETDAYVSVTSDNPVTVNVENRFDGSYNAYGESVPDRKGTAIGTVFVGRCVDSVGYFEAYLYILAYEDGTNVRVYNAENGTPKDQYTLNRGQTVNANAVNGSGQQVENFLGGGLLWRIVSDKPISVQSGAYRALAEFVPLAFDIGGLFLTCTAPGGCVSPVDTTKNQITYNIQYDNSSGESLHGVKIVDHLPSEVDFVSAGSAGDSHGYYDASTHTCTWNIGTLADGGSDAVSVTVKVNDKAGPSDKVTNTVQIQSLDHYNETSIDVGICSWGTTPENSVIYVDDDATGSNNGTSWQDAFTDLQDALDEAKGFSGEPVEIRVAQGIYTPRTRWSSYIRSATFELINNAAIKGGYAGVNGEDPDDRMLDIYETVLSGDLHGDDIQVDNPADLASEETRAENCYSVVSAVGTDGTAVLDGFIITGGRADTLDSGFYGAGMYNEDASPVVLNCTFTSNFAWEGGGGMCNYRDSSPEVVNCTFSKNAAYQGGGMCNQDGSSPKLTKCTFNGNTTVADGGGMYNRVGEGKSSVRPELTDCIFIENETAFAGGGMYNYAWRCGNNHGCEVTLTDCTFVRNTAYYYDAWPVGVGGGIVNETTGSSTYGASSRLKLTNCTFNGNTAVGDGGAIYNATQGGSFTLDMVNSVLCGNSAGSSYVGGAIHNSFYRSDVDCTCELALTNCTFASNAASDGKALVCRRDLDWDPSSVELVNCILWDGGSEILNSDGSTITITYSDIYGGPSGGGNIHTDPLFVDVDGDDDIAGTEDDDLRLLSTSPCLDAGDNDAVPEVIEADIDGNPRRIDDSQVDSGNGDPPIVDMGAYERTFLTVEAGGYGPLTLLPTNEVSQRLDQASIDPPNPDGEETFLWSVTEGPGSVDFDSPGFLQPTVTFYTLGTYVIKLKAFVDAKEAGWDTTTIAVGLDVQAGTYDDVYMKLGQAVLDLEGAVTPPLHHTVKWSRASGPGGVSFQNYQSTVTQATFTLPGKYDLRLEALNTDGDVVGSCVTTIWVYSLDQAPVIEAGSPPESPPSLYGGTGQYVSCDVTDAWYVDGAPTVERVEWSVDGGATGVSFNPAVFEGENLDHPVGKLDTEVRFENPGVFHLRLSAKSDDVVVAEDTVTIEVKSSNKPPVIEAGIYDVVVLPDALALNGEVEWDENPATVHSPLWTASVPEGGQVSASPSPAEWDPIVSFTADGKYVLTLTAFDEKDVPGQDDVTIMVYPEPEPEPTIVITGEYGHVTLPDYLHLKDARIIPGSNKGVRPAWSCDSPDVQFLPSAFELNPVVVFAEVVEAKTYTLRLEALLGDVSVADATVSVVVKPDTHGQDTVAPQIDEFTAVTTADGHSIDGELVYGEIAVTIRASDDHVGMGKIELFRRDADLSEHLMKIVYQDPYNPRVLQLDHVFHTWHLPENGTYTLLARVTDRSENRPDDGEISFTSTGPTAGSTDPPIAEITNLDDDAGANEFDRDPLPVIDNGLFELRGSAYHPDEVVTDVRYKIELFKNQIAGTEHKYWTLGWKPYHESFVKNVTPGLPDGAEWKTGEIGPNPETSSFGMLDFTQIDNGPYQLLLTVRHGPDDNPIESTASVGFVLDTRMKIGTVRFSQEDLVVPVGGIPLRVVRTYDSLRKDHDGDFGHGWSYSIVDMDIQLDEERWIADPDPELGGGVEKRTIRAGANFNRNVTLTLPDGTRTTFLFYLKWHGGNLFEGEGGYHTAEYASPPGVYAKLEAYHKLDPWAPEKMIGGCWYSQSIGNDDARNHDFTGYRLTTEDGTQYYFERKDYGLDYFVYTAGGVPFVASPKGDLYLNRIVSPSGETIRLNVNLDNGHVGEKEELGIQYVDGAGNATRAIEIKYDQDDRIIEIWAPKDKEEAGTYPTVKYEYDPYGYGNLWKIHKLVNRGTGKYESTEYVYEDDNHGPGTHYITEIKDPRGLSPIRYVYDDKDRLIGIYDAKQNYVDISHNDVEGKKAETVSDRYGNQTIYFYNDRGNVVLIRNAQGQETTYAYGDQDNPDKPTSIAVQTPEGPSTTRHYYWNEHGNSAHMSRHALVDPMNNLTYTYYDTKGNVKATITGIFHSYDPATDEVSYDEVVTTINEYYLDNGGTLSLFEGELTNLPAWTEVSKGEEVLQRTEYTYDSQRRINTIVQRHDPAGAISDKDVITKYEYDEGLSGSSTQPYRVSEPYYRGDEQAPPAAGPPFYVQHFAYDENGNQIRSWYVWDDPDEGPDKTVTTHTDYDAQGRVIKTRRDVDGVEVILSQTAYNKIGRIDYTINEIGLLTKNDYDASGNLLQTATYETTEGYLGINANGQLVRYYGSGPQEEVYADFAAFEADGTTNLLTVSQSLCDKEDRVIVSVGPYDPTDPELPVGTETVYDELGRAKETRRWKDVAVFLDDLWGNDPDTGVPVIVGKKIIDGIDDPADAWTAGAMLSYTRTEYDSAGRVNMTVALDEDGYEQPTTYEYDLASKQIAVRDPQGHNITYKEAEPRPKEILTAVWDETKGFRTEYEYEGTRRVAVRDAAAYVDEEDPGTWSYKWQTGFDYDALGRLVKTTHPPAKLDEVDDPIDDDLEDDPTYTYVAYDALGRKMWQSAQTRQTDREHVDDPVEDDATKLRKREFEYDAAGELRAVILPAVILDPGPPPSSPIRPRYEYDYDVYGNLTEIRDNISQDPTTGVKVYTAARATKFKYDVLHNQASHTLANGNEETKQYDPLGRLELSYDFRGQATEYTYNSRGLLEYKKYFEQGQYPTTVAEQVQYVHNKLGRCEQVIHSTHGTTIYDYDAEGNIESVLTPEGTINYTYHAVTNRKATTSTDNTTVAYTYDVMGRLGGVHLSERNDAGVSEITAYGYNAVGSRDTTNLPNGVVSSYVYDKLNRLTEVTHADGAAPPRLLGSYTYTLGADGRREKVNEELRQTGALSGSPTTEIHDISYTYDSLNRIQTEEADAWESGQQIDGSYSTSYEYDLVGNRTLRMVTAGAASVETAYTYDTSSAPTESVDKLLTEEHRSPSALYMNGRRVYAYAQNGRFGHYRMEGVPGDIGPFRAFRLGLPSKWSQYLFRALVLMLVLSFIAPALVYEYLKLRKRELRGPRTHLSLSHRCLSALLAYVMLIGPMGFEQSARGSTQYYNLATSMWGQLGQTIHYFYDANGSVTQKVTEQASAVIETVTYEYNLQNRLELVVKEYADGYDTVEQITEYTYNDDGLRVGSFHATRVNDHWDEESVETTFYLIDSHNHTGYAQVLEELVYDHTHTDPNPLEDAPTSRKTYTIGDDVITQQVSGDPAQHLLYDGHGSTRQLALPEEADDRVEIASLYSYDAYGVMLGGNPGSPSNPDAPATNLLYAGEQFDIDAQQYYLRARYYDPLNGRFNRMDPFAGDYQDPQSLHKYLYCHANPVNAIDPVGEATTYAEQLTVGTLISELIAVCAPYAMVGLLGLTTAVALNIIYELSHEYLAAGLTTMAEAIRTSARQIAEALRQAAKALKETVKEILKHKPYFVFERFTPNIYRFTARCLVWNPMWYSLTWHGNPTKTMLNRRWVLSRYGYLRRPGYNSIDEFPYASTNEGGRPFAQACAVPLRENWIQGGYLKAHYYGILRRAPAKFLVIPVPK